MGRAPCCEKSGVKKGPWTSEEDQKLVNYIENHGTGNWRTLPKNAGLERCGKSCRLRWTNYLRPDIKRGRFSFEEEETIIQLHSIMGNKWSAIAGRLPGRTDNEIKNYWNTHIRKRLLKMGIDPVTHASRLDLLDLSSMINSALCNSPLFNLSSLLGNQAIINSEWLKMVSHFFSLKTENLQHTQLENISQLQNNMNSQFQTSNMEGFFSNMSTFRSELPESFNYIPDQNYGCLSGNPNFQPQDHPNYIHPHPIQSYDSAAPTPLSSPTPLNSPSKHVNSSTEDERDSYCSNLFKFEFPESFDDMNDLM